ncbi:MAG: hypothetical protein K1Y36_27055 [Blastocatellia bacterium]|nr:hypothetical protein [Blastocatellia bacterium]
MNRSRFLSLLLTVAVAGGLWLIPGTRATSSKSTTSAKGQVSALKAGSPDGIWQEVAAEAAEAASQGTRYITPSKYKVFRFDQDAFSQLVKDVPMEFSSQAESNARIFNLPMPDGSFSRFRIAESPVMEPGLRAKFPYIRTYNGQGIDDPTAIIRFDRTQFGFHAMVLSGNGTLFVDPLKHGETTYYQTYFKQDYLNKDKRLNCGVTETEEAEFALRKDVSQNPTKEFSNGTGLRTYRLAGAATGEYTAFHGGSVAGGLAGMTTTVNRVSGVYERELGVRLVLIANNDQIIYTNAATDPYTNNSGSTLLGQNQTNLDNVIGAANYDIGHVFSTGGGGVAGLGVVCRAGNKARGVTGSSSPIGDGYDIDYVAHEMGHQFGCNHTFNGTTGSCGGGNRSASHAYEPGSGTTIMPYAGICGAEDLQPHSDDYFHVESLREALNYLSGSGGCQAIVTNGNQPPTADAGGNFTIPANTPFALTGSGTDPNNDTLTYCWEEFDLGTAGPPNTDNGTRPIFRSFNPSTNPTRTFPKLSDILNNTTTFGEAPITTSRTMNFRVTVRDNRAGGGGVADAGMQVTTVATAGPFIVTAPDTAVTLTGNSQTTITWNVANTTAAPISAANVRILLSTDGGQTFPTVISASTPNDGTESVTVPNVNTTQGRIRVEAVGNIFFDISNANFTINAVVNNPTVTGFAPFASFPGKTIVVTGTNFVAGNTQVFFGGANLIPATSVTVVNSTTLNVVVPNSGTGAANINGFLTVRVNSTDVTTAGLTDNSTTPCAGNATFSQFVMWGDITGDGLSAQANDVALARAFTQFQATPTVRQRIAADVIPSTPPCRGDGTLTTTDITFLRAVSFGQASF